MNMENKYHSVNLEEFKQNLINDNTLGLTPADKIKLINSSSNNLTDIIIEICKKKWITKT